MADEWDDALADFEAAEEELDRQHQSEPEMGKQPTKFARLAANKLSASRDDDVLTGQISTASAGRFDASAFSGEVGDSLEALGVQSANASALEAHIEAQIEAKARAAEQAALERREAQQVRRRRELRKQQERAAKQQDHEAGGGGGGGGGGSKSSSSQAAEADPARAKRDAKQERLARELQTLEKQVADQRNVAGPPGSPGYRHAVAEAQWAAACDSVASAVAHQQIEQLNRAIVKLDPLDGGAPPPKNRLWVATV